MTGNRGLRGLWLTQGDRKAHLQQLVKESDMALLITVTTLNHHSLIVVANPFGTLPHHPATILHLDSTGMAPEQQRQSTP